MKSHRKYFHWANYNRKNEKFQEKPNDTSDSEHSIDSDDSDEECEEANKALPHEFWNIFYQIIDKIKDIGRKVGLNIFDSLYENDSQITKMFLEEKIDCVISHDYDYVHYGVPMILNFASNEEAIMIDLNRTKGK